MIAARALALLVALALPVRAQSGVVALLVIDDATDAAMPDVRVSVIGRPMEGMTDAHGRYSYTAPRPGRVALVLRRLGYLPGTLMVDVGATDTARVTFAMTVAAQTLATVDVRDTMSSRSPTLAGFEHRVHVGAGSATYITREQIDKAHASRVTDLLRRTTSITLEDSADVVLVLTRRSGKIAKCPLQLGVDGELRFGMQLNMLVPEEIHGIEIYPGPATLPAEFGGMRGTLRCGLVMIWTRRDR